MILLLLAGVVVAGTCVIVALIPDEVWQSIAERIRTPHDDVLAQRLRAMREPDRSMSWPRNPPKGDASHSEHFSGDGE